MKNTLKSILAIAAIGTSSIASAALIPASGTVYIENTPFDGGSGDGIHGGEFRAVIGGFGTFYTFCMEFESQITLPGTYNFVSNNTVDSHVDVVSKGTAYLYQTFVAGGLYTRSLDAAHDFNAGLLQAAIWFLEDEVDGTWESAGTFLVGNPFIAAAISKFGDLTGAKADYMGDRVAVLNLKNAAGKQRQDVLISVPDSGATLALLGLAIVSLGAARRRFSRIA